MPFMSITTSKSQCCHAENYGDAYYLLLFSLVMITVCVRVQYICINTVCILIERLWHPVMIVLRCPGSKNGETCDSTKFNAVDDVAAGPSMCKDYQVR